VKNFVLDKSLYAQLFENKLGFPITESFRDGNTTPKTDSNI
jgi:hypothetical protein